MKKSVEAQITMKSVVKSMILAVAVSVAALTHPAQAGSLLLRSEVAELAGIAYQNYRHGRVNAMLSDENECWNDAAKESGEVKRVLVAACATTAMAGAIVEATHARKQGRGSHSAYTGEGARERIFRRSGLSEQETQQIMEETVERSVPAILSGLQGAGMR